MDYLWSTGSWDDSLQAGTTHGPPCCRGDEEERGTSHGQRGSTEEAKVEARPSDDAASSPAGCCLDVETGGPNHRRRFEQGGIDDELVGVESGDTRTSGSGNAIATRGAGGPTNSYTVRREPDGIGVAASPAVEADWTMLEMATSGLRQPDGTVAKKPPFATLSAQNHSSKCPTGSTYLLDEVMHVRLLGVVEANSTTGFVSTFPVEMGGVTAR